MGVEAQGGFSLQSSHDNEGEAAWRPADDARQHAQALCPNGQNSRVTNMSAMHQGGSC